MNRLSKQNIPGSKSLTPLFLAWGSGARGLSALSLAVRAFSADSDYLLNPNPKGPKYLYGGMLAQTIIVIPIIETLHF